MFYYVYRQRDRVDRFLSPFLLGVLLCYVQFPFWPSGQDFPSVNTIFRQFSWWMLGGYVNAGDGRANRNRTVYGRYHFLADPLAGFAMCLVAQGCSYRRREESL